MKSTMMSPSASSCSRCPLLIDAAPAILNYYHATATENDLLIAGPSGVGYFYGNVWPSDSFAEFLAAGADAVTLGNHSWDQREALVFIERQDRLVRPANYPKGTPGRGATVIEKHFTLDRNMPGPDHKASLEPPELARMVRDIRALEVAFGDGVKAPQPSEWDTRKAARQQTAPGNLQPATA